jgi:hypothetical protein
MIRTAYIIPQILLVLILCESGGADERPSFTFDQMKLKDAIRLEKSYKSKRIRTSVNISVSKNNYPHVDKYTLPQPVVYQKGQLNGVPILATYFYSTPDRIIRYVSYTWQKGSLGNLPERMTIAAEEQGHLERYNDIFNILLDVLLEELGDPDQLDDQPKMRLRNNKETYRRSAKWADDNRNVSLFLSVGPTRLIFPGLEVYSSVSGGVTRWRVRRRTHPSRLLPGSLPPHSAGLKAFKGGERDLTPPPCGGSPLLEERGKKLTDRESGSSAFVNSRQFYIRVSFIIEHIQPGG